MMNEHGNARKRRPKKTKIENQNSIKDPLNEFEIKIEEEFFDQNSKSLNKNNLNNSTEQDEISEFLTKIEQIETEPD